MSCQPRLLTNYTSVGARPPCLSGARHLGILRPLRQKGVIYSAAALLFLCPSTSRGEETSTESNENDRHEYDQFESSASPAERLAEVAYRVARRRNSHGRCYSAVKEAVATALGVRLGGRSAYMAAHEMAHRHEFLEIFGVRAVDLAYLPEGTLVVWAQTPRSPHGHVSVSVGNGLEASDHLRPQMTSHRGNESFRVFLPKSKLHH